MSAVTETTIKIDLAVESAILLGKIATNSGESREMVASRAIELWLDRYRIHGPAFSRTEAPPGAPDQSAEPSVESGGAAAVSTSSSG